jgi:REP element-mobilizing transposase RayT
MARPLRIEFPGAHYHVTSRGDRREAIFLDDDDRRAFLDLLAQSLLRFDAAVLAYCLMGNHYHLVLVTRAANLSALMRHLNGVYTQRFNRRHDKTGHVFQGRFKAILVDRDAYLLQVCRYVELNPVRAGLVPAAGAWPWSSHRANAGQAPVPPGLDCETLHALVPGTTAGSASASPVPVQAHAAWSDWVHSSPGGPLWESGLRQQIFLGDQRFVEQMQTSAAARSAASPEIPRPQRSLQRSLADWLQRCSSREEAFRQAHVTSGMTMSAIAREAGLSVSRVSQLIARAEKGFKSKT